MQMKINTLRITYFVRVVEVEQEAGVIVGKRIKWLLYFELPIQYLAFSAF